MAKKKFLPLDVSQRDYAPYWAASLAVAIQRSDNFRIKKSLKNLHRLGIALNVGVGPEAKTVAHAQ